MHVTETKNDQSRWVALFALSIVVTFAVIALATLAGAAPSKPAPTTAPTITNGPSGRVASTTAAFTYTHPAGSFVCSLDGAAFKVCSTKGITFTALSEGPHEFLVAATNGGSDRGPAASRTWIVDTRPPATTVTSPEHNRTYRPATWATACGTTAGPICGTAGDGAGVSWVEVAVEHTSTGLFWDGASFSSRSTVRLRAQGTTEWTLPLALPADGAYAVRVWSLDGIGNATNTRIPAAASFTVDSVAPAAPTITGPEGVSTSTSASFTYKSAESSVSFECALDGAGFSPCGASVKYDDLALGDHTFQVRAVDAAGNTGAAAEHEWTIAVSGTFTVTGAPSAPFYPGSSQPVNLRITNPYSFDLVILEVTATVQSTTKRADGTDNPDCDGPTNLTETRALATEPTAIVVPRSTTRTLAELEIPQEQWPVLEMPNLDANQDGCKNTTFTVTYEGTAARP